MELRKDFQAAPAPGFILNLDFNYVEQVNIISNYTPFDALARIGSLYIAIGWILGIFAPFVVIYFQNKMGGVFQVRHEKEYRQELENLIAKSLGQLKKVKSLCAKPQNKDFMPADLMTEIDKMMVYSLKSSQGEDVFRNKDANSLDSLHQVLTQMIDLIKRVQVAALARRDGIINNELETLNQNKPLDENRPEDANQIP